MKRYILKITDLEGELLGVHSIFAKTRSEAQTKANNILPEYGEEEDIDWELLEKD